MIYIEDYCSIAHLHLVLFGSGLRCGLASLSNILLVSVNETTCLPEFALTVGEGSTETW